MTQLLLKRASLSRPFRQWDAHDYDVVADGEVIGRILKASVSVARPWMWTLDCGNGEDRTHGYAATREAAMAAFAKAWQRD
jgi:hypothetical protein